MGTVPESVRAYAEGYFIPRSRVFVIARTMREEDPDLLPRDPVGRNMGVLCLPPHLVHLAVGVAVADPIAKVTEQVRAYMAARYIPPTTKEQGAIKAGPALLGRRTLGPGLYSLVDFLARPSAEEREMRARWRGVFRVTFVVGGGRLGAVVEDRETTHLDVYSAEGPQPPPDKHTFRLHGKDFPVVPMQRIVHLEFAHFELAAELWRDSLQRGAVYTPSALDPSGIKPEAETAASGPARDQNATVVSDQTASAEPGRHSQSYPMRGRQKAQLPCVERSGHPHHHPRMYHDRTDEHAAGPGS